jgi:hypothetical protein
MRVSVGELRGWMLGIVVLRMLRCVVHGIRCISWVGLAGVSFVDSAIFLSDRISFASMVVESELGERHPWVGAGC